MAGRIVACGWVIKACQRYRRMRDRAADPTCSFVWSSAHAQEVCAFVERLPHVEGRWATETITLEPWQTWMLAAIYGFRRREDGGRLVATMFFQVSRKSAKSSLVAALAAYHLAHENEPGAQVVCGATTGTQARIVFGILQRMVRRSQWLRELGFAAWANAVTFNDGTAKPINAKSSSQDGLNPSFVSLDESHAQDFMLHDVLKSAQGARTSPLLAAPTTAGHDLTSVGYALRQTAIKILDGVIDSDHTFVALYELDPGDDWKDEATWIKAAPMIGITPTLDYVRRYRDDAVATPGLQGEFEVKICSRWLHSAQGWLSIPAWDACAEPALRIEDFAGEACWIGADLAERDDLAAVAYLFQRDDLVYGFVTLYLPQEVVEARARAVPEYRGWLRAGLLKGTSGNLTDVTVIASDIRAACERFDVREIAVERFGALNLHAQLDGLAAPIVLETKNAKTYTQPARELEARIAARSFKHDGNSCLRWQASNCVVERRVDGSLLPKKARAHSPDKIDAIDALLLGLGRLLVASASPTTSIYETRGPLIF
jgi:phage terminase large subunit-like protein